MEKIIRERYKEFFFKKNYYYFTTWYPWLWMTDKFINLAITNYIKHLFKKNILRYKNWNGVEVTST